MSGAKRVFSIPEKQHGRESNLKASWQPKHGTFLAATGSNKLLFIYDRHGGVVEKLPLSDVCFDMAWDTDGDLLALICERTSIVYLWDANNHKLSQIDSQFKDQLTFLSWSKISPILSVGTAKGNLLVYNNQTSKKVPIMGKHSRRISTGCWSRDNLLALGGDDKMLTISNDLGDTLRQTVLRDVPMQIKFSERKQDNRSKLLEGTVSLLLNRRTLFLYSIEDPDNPIELAFQQKYGEVIAYDWYGDGYIMIGFANGFLISISTHLKEIGQELFQLRTHKNYLSDLVISRSLNKAASCGDNCIKVYELQDLKDVESIITLDDTNENLRSLHWSEDGQLLALASMNGSIQAFLTKLPLLASVYQRRIAFMTSLKEISIYDHLSKTKTDPLNLAINIEPTFIASSQNHIAVGFNNRVWFYLLQNEQIQRIGEKEYLNSITELQLNDDYVAVLMGNQLQLHSLAESAIEGRESILFPVADQNEGKITSFALTKEYLIMGTDTGQLCHFNIDDWLFVNKYKHNMAIKKVFPEFYGMSVAFIDHNGEGFIYNPISSSVVKIQNFPSTTKGIIWETFELNKWIFVAYDGETINTYMYSKYSVEGPVCTHIGMTHQPYSSLPLLLFRGVIVLLDSNGKIVQMKLSTHTFELTIDGLKQADVTERMKKNCMLKRFEEAYYYADKVTNKEELISLAKFALFYLEIDFAIRVYRLIGLAEMVFALNTIKHIEEKSLLCGHIAVFLGNFDHAQSMFLASTEPLEALNMRRDLMHWDAALKLAKGLDSSQIPFISLEYAKQLEFVGDYPAALRLFEKGQTNSEYTRDHDEQCLAGIARCSLKTGDIRRGVELAMKLPNKQVKRECAAILEGIRQYTEAGILYEKSESWDKAAQVYIKNKNWTKVGELLVHVTSPKIHAQYGKAKEADGYYKEAYKAYLTAKEYENAIRIQLDYLKNPEQAVKIVKETQSIEGAKMVASFFQKFGDYASAIQFLVMSKCTDEAFQLARMHGQMELYAEVLGKDSNPEDYESVALYFEKENNNFLAGKYYYMASSFNKAIRLLIKVQPNSDREAEAVELAIQCVGKARDDGVTRILIDYLMGDHDGMPKDAKYLFKLYLSLKQYVEATKTAILIARQEQQSGNYRDAHDVLFGMHQDLLKENIKIPFEVKQNLMILHSYILVKIQIKLNNHLRAARLLCRVAENISKFPSHIVQILTSTVIECQKSGLYNSAFNYATMLLRPEYRDTIDPKYKKKIEALVRHPEKSEIEEELTPCPNCNFKMLEYGLTCPGCQITVPYCIITGAHVIREDFSACPSCDFPVLYSEFLKYLEGELNCPMCNNRISRNDVKKIDVIDKYLKTDDTSS